MQNLPFPGAAAALWVSLFTSWIQWASSAVVVCTGCEEPSPAHPLSPGPWAFRGRWFSFHANRVHFSSSSRLLQQFSRCSVPAESRARPFCLLIYSTSQSCGVVYNRMICISFFYCVKENQRSFLTILQEEHVVFLTFLLHPHSYHRCLCSPVWGQPSVTAPCCSLHHKVRYCPLA